MTRRLDPDVRALGGAIRALDSSSSLKMLHANIEFLYDRYVRHPPPDLLQTFEARKEGE